VEIVAFCIGLSCDGDVMKASHLKLCFAEALKFDRHRYWVLLFVKITAKPEFDIIVDDKIEFLVRIAVAPCQD
jgi:hypothetical protein